MFFKIRGIHGSISGSLREAVEFIEDFRLRLATDELSGGLASFEKDEGRDAVHSKLTGERWAFIHIYFADFCLAGAFVGDFVNDG